MPLDPVRIEETRFWFLKARADLRGARVDLDVDPPLIEDALFHAQQAAEKAEKGFLIWHDKPFRKTHDLVELGSACSSIDPSLDSILHEAARLTTYATAFRYPGMNINPSYAQASDALRLADEAVSEILKRLPDDVNG